MRREHETITVDVLDQLSSYLREKGPFHVTVLASRANLPHDRLKGYLDELSSLGFIEPGASPRITVKGLQFLECYHAWVRIQKIYGLDPRAGRGQAARLMGADALRLLPKPAAISRPAPALEEPAPEEAVAAPVEALGVDSHESSAPVPAVGPLVRAP